MGDEDDTLFIEYSEESPFVRAIIEEEVRKKEEEDLERETEEEAARIKKYEVDEKLIGLGWRIYGLVIVTFLNALNYTQQYLLIVTIFGMANELHFGETRCQVINKTLARDYLHDENITGDINGLCSDLERCFENSTLCLPDICGIQYTGQGTLYELLAGPIYMIVQGVVGIPLLGFIQWFSWQPSFIICMFTTLWTLCTLFTAFMNDYWAIALLRFFFGVFSGPYIPVAFSYLVSVFPSKVHTLVVGIAHYGGIAGYGISFLFIYVSDAIGWRWSYFICGAVGVIFAIGSCIMVNPKISHRGQIRTLRPSWKQQREGLKQIVWSVMLSLMFANTSRIAALNVASFNITLYMAEYFPDFNVAIIGVVVLVLSFPGNIFGGILGDLLKKSSGLRGQLWLSLGLMILTLLLVPWVFHTPAVVSVALGGIYLAVSDWFYVVNLAIISDLTPLQCKTAIFALNFFLMYSIGGAVNLIVAPIASLLGLREALTIITGFFSCVPILLLLIPLGLVEYLKKKIEALKQVTQQDKKEEEVAAEHDETTPLTVSYRSR
ncbi:D-galactonate transporter-like [Lytechinus pictus]|uniref:D-galactonate transporter-like n=1 Tax=Lytechinus pictus TaxID=7653 RepID=UPI0030BA2649